MRDDDSQGSLGGRLARAGALIFSGTVAALLILNSGPGCDGPKSEATKTAPTQAPVEQAAPAPAPTPAAPAAQAGGPTPAQAEPPPTEVPLDRELRPNPGNNAGNNARYFPASKSGVFIEPNVPTEPPAREPAVQENAPAQQAPPQPQQRAK